MNPLHMYRASLRLRFVFVALSLLATPACAPSSDESTDAAVEVSARRSPVAAASSFTLFESGQVRPLALSPDKHHLFAVNTPDNRLEIFRIKQAQLIHTASIPVGLEPVAVAARTAHEVWVVNHLSDSVIVVELDDDATTGHVARTLLVWRC